MRFKILAACSALALAFVAAPALAAPGVNMVVSVGAVGDYTNSSGRASQDAHISDRIDLNFLTGSGINQGGKVYTETVSLAASASENDDLTTSADALGATIGLTAVKAVVLIADKTNTNPIVLGNAASNGFSAPFDAATDTVSVPAGGALVLMNPTAAGWTVDSTHKVLKIANGGSGTGVTGKLIIIGQ